MVRVILALLDADASQQDSVTGDPKKSGHPPVNCLFQVSEERGVKQNRTYFKNQLLSLGLIFLATTSSRGMANLFECLKFRCTAANMESLR